ncbi:PLP-dependent aminotransferase family protein [Myceligenerans pegani]|uniref:PLP-dependent aminotransferase family protein n=1 Tax=Myceligenerans pegani TaxID=2776917 RepID=A0ABR9N1A3_9MICO|nr:PLP-dependent aminotransferase family protein [Myceligenerans sp. TRM 65318]MBE1876996.1 PLP-dependent aminotransferase family protein [Myceligenerans sp. TRM 65318]MBE3019267.1 PLP-dependent aminotransferase family protein [Myceligenerans sp. TRM 65318]
MTIAPAAHRQLSAAATARLLGTWHAGGPAYTALSDALRAAVLSGTIAPLTRLPSERELAPVLGVSRTTTAAAYRRLRDLGFATSRVGSGTVTLLPSFAEAPAGGDVAVPDAAATLGDPLGPNRGAGPGFPSGAVRPILLNQATAPAVPEVGPAFERALAALPEHLAHGGYAPYGLAPLREAVAARYRERGVPTTPDQVLVTTGAQNAISLVVRTVLKRADTAVVQSPTYFHALDALREAGARMVGIPAGYDGLDTDLLESAVRRTGARLVFLIPDHHNPTGTSLSPGERAAVRAIAERTGVTVLADETLTDLALSGPPDANPAFDGDGSSPRLITVGSTSKAFWGGLRIGWIRAHPDVVARLVRTRQSTDIATAVMEQLVAADLIALRDEILPARRVWIRERRNQMVRALRGALPWDVPMPGGGQFVWAGLGRPVAHAFAAAAAAEGVMVNAGPALTPDGSSRDRVRLTFPHTPDVLEEAIPRLVRAWHRLT